MRPTRGRLAAFSGARRAVAAVLLGAIPAAIPAQVPAGRGFLLGTPEGTFTLRGGWALASARSDVFSFTTERLTLDRGDFSSPAIAADLSFPINRRTDLVISGAFQGTTKRSEFRAFIDNNDQPIEQRTMFDRVPLTVSVKRYLTNRGRSIGRLAWIPSRFSPYIGAGGGIMWYRFKQVGDFIDFNSGTLDVFPATLASDGWAPTVHALAGGEWNLSPRLAAVTEARYEWAHATLSKDFSGFGRIDLSGLSTTAGIVVRF